MLLLLKLKLSVCCEILQIFATQFVIICTKIYRRHMVKFSLNPGMLLLSRNENPSYHQILLALCFIHIWFDKHTNNTALLMENIYFLLKCYRIKVIGCILHRVHEVVTNWKHFVRLFVFGEYRGSGNPSFFLPSCSSY